MNRRGLAYIGFVFMIALCISLLSGCGGRHEVSGRVDVVVGIDFEGLRRFVEQMCEGERSEEERDECVDKKLRKFFDEVVAEAAAASNE